MTTTPIDPPSDPDPGSPGNVPVNVAVPNWQCPHCRTEYRQDLAAATECAQAGPAADIVEGTPVLALAGAASRKSGIDGNSTALFGLTEVGPVKPVTVDDKRVHRRNVVLAGHQLDPDRLESAHRGADGLLVVTDTRERHGNAQRESPSLSTFSTLAKIMLGPARYGRHDDTPVTVWFEGYRSGKKDVGWWAAPDQGQRAALNIITNGLLDKIVETPTDDLAAEIRKAYGPNQRAHRASQRAVDFAGTSAALAIADAHGSPNDIWALRWLTVHLDEVTRWQAEALRTWAAGTTADSTTDPVAVMPGVSYLRVAESLPRNPGKRREAVLEPYGSGYEDSRNTIVKQLSAATPTNPVPGIADVETSLRSRTERHHTPEGN